VVSVTSDVSASATYQGAPPKPALPDPSQLTSSFASLIDSSLPVDPASTLPPTPEPAPANPPHQANDTPPPDNNPSRNSQAAADQNTPSQADNSDSNPPPASAHTKNSGDTDAPSRSGKSDGSKTTDGKSADKTSTDATHGNGTDAPTEPADTQTVTQNPIAALIPVANGPTNTPQTAVDANAPLAIAAAAIAATSSTTASLAPTDVKADASLAGTKASATATTEKTPAQAPATGAAAAQPVATDPDVTAAADAAMTAVAGTPGAAKANTTGFKPVATGQTKTSTASTSNAKGTSDPSATTMTTDAAQNNAAPQPTTDGKPNANATLADALKPGGNGASPPSTTHDHSAVVGSGQALAPQVDANVPLAVLPQQLSPATAVNATDKFTVTQATGAPVPISGLAVQIAATVQSGKTRFEVRLDPADLGRIDVRIDVDRNGQVTSHLTVEKPETLSMLKQDAPQLQQALNDAGLKTGSGGLQFSLRDQSSSGQNNPNQSGGQAQRLVIKEEDAVPAAVAGRSYGRVLGANGGVDIRV